MTIELHKKLRDAQSAERRTQKLEVESCCNGLRCGVPRVAKADESIRKMPRRLELHNLYTVRFLDIEIGDRFNPKAGGTERYISY